MGAGLTAYSGSEGRGPLCDGGGAAWRPAGLLAAALACCCLLHLCSAGSRGNVLLLGWKVVEADMVSAVSIADRAM